MRKRKKLVGVLMIVASLIIMQLPVSEADAASSSASDFRIEGGTLVKYRGTDKNVSVPDTVKTIAQGAFEDDTNVELVVLPNSVKQIESYAFWGCENLDTVVLGKGLTAVGDYAFAGCAGLEQMTIPSSVTSIGIQAFGDCVNLKDISIPPETTSIHETAFDGCYQLTIHSEAGSAADTFATAFYERLKEKPEYEDVPGYNKPEDETDQEPEGNAPSATPGPGQSPTDPGETPTPEPDREPEQTPVPDPVIPTPEPDYSNGLELGSTKVVGNSAVVFLNPGSGNVLGGENPAVPSEELPTAASDYMDVSLEEGIAKYAIVDQILVADHAFYRSQEMQDVVLPQTIREIGQFSFARSSLESIVFPQGMEKVSYGAFYHCDNLKEVSLPDSIQSVEPKAFDHTAWVDTFLQGGSNGQTTEGMSDYLVSGGVLVAYRGTGSEAVIPDGVRVIAAEAFLGHEELESVIMPDSLRVIGEGAFENCTGLEQIVLKEGLEQIKDRAFSGCGNVGTVSVPASVKTLGLGAFDGLQVEYAGEAPGQTFEESATRLSNEAYRILEEEGEQKESKKPEGENETADSAEPKDQTTDNGESGNASQEGETERAETGAGVTVSGVEGAFASLAGAGRSYRLQIDQAQSPEPMEKACMRAFRSEMPQGMVVYDLQLSDSSDIPLTKLGHQELTVALPLPEHLQGQNIRVFILDRNGQIEVLPADRVRINGKDAVWFETNKVSMIGIYGTGEADQEEDLLEVTMDMIRMSAGPGADPAQERNRAYLVLFQWCAAGAVLLMGIGLLLPGGKKRRKA